MLLEIPLRIPTGLQRPTSSARESRGCDTRVTWPSSRPRQEQRGRPCPGLSEGDTRGTPQFCLRRRGCVLSLGCQAVGTVWPRTAGGKASSASSCREPRGRHPQRHDPETCPACSPRSLLSRDQCVPPPYPTDPSQVASAEPVGDNQLGAGTSAGTVGSHPGLAGQCEEGLGGLRGYCGRHQRVQDPPERQARLRARCQMGRTGGMCPGPPARRAEL